MPKRSDFILLADIIQNIQLAIHFSEGLKLEMFKNDLKTQLATDRCFEIVGEAARNLSTDFINNHTNIEWHKLIAFRNVLIHEYFRVDRNIQWNILKTALPPLLKN
ncbi:HepT-like ribonuclease domain-containing protein [Niabella ginsengisoli]|uniref:DUF86 domain-containing protein n=1 Tax=Niabella ginsengisoli TaxID=522298 RepID=A0ABS9SQN1_9BACT|nr:HepT-like ribonuclease domain-containing protein [Niabella ginsengisoli]MCH5600667.1 DUF86 domain-containing protein [Niabella ginsengisoli]